MLNEQVSPDGSPPAEAAREQLLHIAAALSHASAALTGLSGGALPPPLRAAKAELRGRRLRDQVFDDAPGLFGEPAWDILLDLFEREARGQATCVSSSTIAANVPSTTALRYLHTLERLGLICREPDVDDRRRSFIKLTPAGSAKMHAIFGPAPSA